MVQLVKLDPALSQAHYIYGEPNASNYDLSFFAFPEFVTWEAVGSAFSLLSERMSVDLLLFLIAVEHAFGVRCMLMRRDFNRNP